MSGANMTMVGCPFVYGSIAYYLGKKADQYASHKWSLYVRGPNFEDLSCFVSKVIFTLHPSFQDPIREIIEPPYQVSEYGWGEFEAGIRIFFRDSNEQPIDLIHHIRLYPPPVDGTTVEAQSTKVPVVSECYDEVVFTDPAETFKRLLMMYSVSQADINAMNLAIGMEHYTKFDDDADLQQLANIQDYVIRETDIAKARLLQVESELNAMLADPNTILNAPMEFRPVDDAVTMTVAAASSSSNAAVPTVTKGRNQYSAGSTAGSTKSGKKPTTESTTKTTKSAPKKVRQQLLP
jgi:YEATS domain-containing protein 4